MPERRIDRLAIKGQMTLATDSWSRSQATTDDDRDALLRSIIETSPDGLVTIDEAGLILSFNPAAEKMFGYRADEVIGRKVDCLMPAPFQKEHDAYMKRYLDTGEKRIIGIGRQVLAKKKDGAIFPIDLAVGEVRLVDGKMFAGFIRDVSARHAVEQSVNELRNELLHVSRLSEMGEMASALAHELNQPLTAIINYLEACKRLAERDDDGNQDQTKGLMQKASAQAYRASQIIQQLRKFIAKGETERHLESINAVVREAAELALVGTRQLDIAASFDLAPGLPEILIDRVQIQQVIMNLVRNSVDALKTVTKRDLTLHTASANGQAIRIEVIDSGSGLSNDVQKKLFQPFVTTKKGGLGIGLSICKTIVEAHHGKLWATARPEGGTIFHIDLPIETA